MKLSSQFFALFILSIISFTNSVYAQVSHDNPISTNLSLGTSGPQVLALQQILNRDVYTRIAATGPGSPGQETNYFGPATKAAVIRFQEKYATIVLAPAGLTQGNGRVGAFTRAQLNSVQSVSATVTPVAPLTLAPKAAATSTTSLVQNPNLKNVDRFFSALDTIAAKQHISSSTLAAMKTNVLIRLATTTDLRAQFEDLVLKKSHHAQGPTSASGKILATLERTFSSLFLPSKARAAESVPFGGQILFAVPCDGGVWNITLSPLPPTFPELLSYETGSQAVLSYNIPDTTWLLGEYDPVPMAYCWIGIYPYPSEGLISPITGSSPW